MLDLGRAPNDAALVQLDIDNAKGARLAHARTIGARFGSGQIIRP
jgi:hypothetical protein